MKNFMVWAGVTIILTFAAVVLIDRVSQSRAECDVLRTLAVSGSVMTAEDLQARLSGQKTQAQVVRLIARLRDRGEVETELHHLDEGERVIYRLTSRGMVRLAKADHPNQHL